ncbi:ArnT family glycosyltransferase [Paenibacillus sp. MBLB4367]|uniref:ArnT family glycosyltransferase n=1 Tax=Paenibacillus sp. MBLB4367 TaxID=3384767 RepID=UPI0039081447
MAEKWKEHRVAVFLLLLLLLLRLPYLGASPYEYDSWRQSDTEAMARNFVENRFNPFYPQMHYEGPQPNYVQLELQITTFLIAILYKLFGFHYELARIVPVLFFTGSAVFVYLIARHYFAKPAAWIAIVLYGSLPLTLLYSRAIMPESAALFFFTGCFYFFSRWIKEDRLWVLLLAAVFTALAISQKVPTVFVGLPMIGMAVAKYKLRSLWSWKLWGFALLSLLPPYLYFVWLASISEYTFVSGIASKHVIPNFLHAFYTKGGLDFFRKELPEAFTVWGIALFAAGLASLHWRKHYPLGLWAIAMILEALTVVAVIKFNYYLIFLCPLVALLGARFLHVLGKARIGMAASLVIASAACWAGLQTAIPSMHKQQAELIHQAAVVQQLTNIDDLIVVGTDDPSLLNASNRNGWRVTNTLPGKPIEELQTFKRQGAKYFVPLKGFIYDDDGKVKAYLDAHFEKIEAEGGYSIYRLNP